MVPTSIRKVCCLLVLELAAIVSTPQVEGATISLTAVQDGTLYETNDGQIANGSGEYFFVGSADNGAGHRRGLLKFDLAAEIPPRAAIKRVSLRLNMSQTNGGTAAINIHRLTREWGEGASNATDTEFLGASTEAGDATWIHAQYPGTAWSQPGGDYLPVATTGWTSVTGPGIYTLSARPSSRVDLITDVQFWLENPNQNFGWLLIGPELPNSTIKRFDSSEHNQAANRPRLTIEFEVPEPYSFTMAAVLLAGSLGTLVWRPSR